MAASSLPPRCLPGRVSCRLRVSGKRSGYTLVVWADGVGLGIEEEGVVGYSSCQVEWCVGRHGGQIDPSSCSMRVLFFSFLVVDKEASVLVGYLDHGVGQGVVCVWSVSEDRGGFS